ncbi:MAG: response regulator transcription factor [Clostridia bacterium]|nr:response regulator transcription factor [Clostridia bacterium]
MKVWCVEDEKGIRDIEVYTLKSTGFDSEGFSDGKSFYEKLKNDNPDLVILDIMLPDTDGVEILKRLRASDDTKDIPVIMATAKGMEYDKIQSLDLGADDYLVKPFGMLEMVSRIKAVLRRCKPKQEESIIRIKGIEINLNERTVHIDGKRITLTYKEFELLKLFMSNPGIVYSREHLFYEIWGQDYFGESRTVDMHIRTLRKKIEPYDTVIETVRNVGYRLEAKS